MPYNGRGKKWKGREMDFKEWKHVWHTMLNGAHDRHIGHSKVQAEIAGSKS